MPGRRKKKSKKGSGLNKKRGQVFTFASSLTLFDKVKDTHYNTPTNQDNKTRVLISNKLN